MEISGDDNPGRSLRSLAVPAARHRRRRYRALQRPEPGPPVL